MGFIQLEFIFIILIQNPGVFVGMMQKVNPFKSTVKTQVPPVPMQDVYLNAVIALLSARHFKSVVGLSALKMRLF